MRSTVHCLSFEAQTTEDTESSGNFYPHLLRKTKMWYIALQKHQETCSYHKIVIIITGNVHLWKMFCLY